MRGDGPAARVAADAAVTSVAVSAAVLRPAGQTTPGAHMAEFVAMLTEERVLVVRDMDARNAELSGSSRPSSSPCIGELEEEVAYLTGLIARLAPVSRRLQW